MVEASKITLYVKYYTHNKEDMFLLYSGYDMNILKYSTTQMACGCMQRTSAYKHLQGHIGIMAKKMETTGIMGVI